MAASPLKWDTARVYIEVNLNQVLVVSKRQKEDRKHCAKSGSRLL